MDHDEESVLKGTIGPENGRRWWHRLLPLKKHRFIVTERYHGELKGNFQCIHCGYVLKDVTREQVANLQIWGVLCRCGWPIGPIEFVRGHWGGAGFNCLAPMIVCDSSLQNKLVRRTAQKCERSHDAGSRFLF